MATSLAIGGSKYFVNQSASNWSGIGSLINLHLLLHSWMWSDMWVDVVWNSEVKRFVPVSYQIANWKCVKKDIARALKSKKECCDNSMYHFAAILVRVIWKSCRWIEPSIKELDEHHKWNVITWFFGSSLGLPSKLGISEGSFIGMVGQEGSLWIGSFINIDKSGRSKVARNGSYWFGFGY